MDFCKSNLTVNGNVHTNGTLNIGGNNINVNGDCSSAGGMTKECGNVNIKNQIKNPKIVNMILISNKIKNKYSNNNCDTFNRSFIKEDTNINLTKFVYSKEEVKLIGNIG